VTSGTTTKLSQNPLLSVLLLAVFAARALVPIGFMPSAGGLVFCQGVTSAHAGLSASLVDHSSASLAPILAPTDNPLPHHGGDATDHEKSSVCPFAAAVTSLASGHLAGPVLAVTGDAKSPPVPQRPFVPLGTVVPTRLPRGPPVLG
jgi:hypothetical protein